MGIHALTLWSRVLLSTLARLGVRHLVISPGSRSTPFVVAALEEPAIERHVIVDERSAGFFALGMARATGTCPALLCTSGSAAAHYLPAVVEADASGLPLLILTADRPTDLHQCDAPQTSRHARFFADFVRESLDLGLPRADIEAFRALRRKVAQAFAAATDIHAGPAHVNAPAAKPLEPRAPTTPDEIAFASAIERLLEEPVPRRAGATLTPSADDVDTMLGLAKAHRRGVVVAGPSHEPDVGARLAQLAASLGYPLLAETTSQAAWGPAEAGGLVRVTRFELALRTPTGREKLAPELAFVVGQNPTSAGWENVARTKAMTQVIVSRHPWSDPSSRASWLVRGPVVPSMDALLARLPSPLAPDTSWLDRWRTASRACDEQVDDALAAWAPSSEGRAIRALLAALPDDVLFFVGNSLAVREVDVFAPRRERGPITLSQRGVNGIDGSVSGVLGAAAATGRPVVALVGDVTLLHDIGGFAAAYGVQTSVVLVVVNNGGGRIFELLPLAAARTDLDAWTTPGRHVTADLVRGFGVRHVAVSDDASLRGALGEALGIPGPTCIEVLVDPAAARREQASVLASLETVLALALA